MRGALAVLAPGTGFTVLEEDGDWWRVESGQGTGWVEHRYCMVNLPDVVPSIIYDAANSYSSRYQTSGKNIPGITGEALYPGAVYNPRLEREEFLMPVLYSMAPKICQVQQVAPAQGNSLIFYEGYRPHATQRAVIRAVSALAAQDPEVKEGISAEPWNISWFIATGYSNHQRGFAMDVGLPGTEAAAGRSSVLCGGTVSSPAGNPGGHSFPGYCGGNQLRDTGGAWSGCPDW